MGLLNAWDCRDGWVTALLLHTPYRKAHSPISAAEEKSAIDKKKVLQDPSGEAAPRMLAVLVCLWRLCRTRGKHQCRTRGKHQCRTRGKHQSYGAELRGKESLWWRKFGLTPRCSFGSSASRGETLDWRQLPTPLLRLWLH